MTVDYEAPVAGKVDVGKLSHSVIKLAPTEFTRDAMLGAALILDTRENPLRLNLFASAIRIFLDHMMDALAPQEEVEACRWFEPVEGQDRPTRNARLTYALIGGFTAAQVEELTGIETKSLIRTVIAAYGKLNKHVHGREDTVVRDVVEQDAIAEDILYALAELLEAYRDYRSEIVGAIADSLQSEAVEKFTTDTVDGVDILAAHHTIDWVGIDDRTVVAITATDVEYEIAGSIGVTLLYGSGSDRAKGDGAEMSDQFPISMRFKVPIEAPHDLSQAEITSGVDTTSWFDQDDDADDEL